MVSSGKKLLYRKDRDMGPDHIAKDIFGKIDLLCQGSQ